MDSVRRGWINGFVGMVMFSGSLPATRIAVGDLDPVFLTLARAAIAGLIAFAVLIVLPQRWPRRHDFVSLVVVAAGCVIAFPLLTALALREMTAVDALVFVGLLPLATAFASWCLGDTRPRPGFWLFATIGAAIVVGFAASRGGRVHGTGALLMLAAIAACGLGYAEGARITRRLGGWQVISWALVLALPVSLPLALLDQPFDWSTIGLPAFAALAYVSVISMLVGFIFWYDGLAKGGAATVGQLQLLQPFFGLVAAALLLRETIGGAPLLMLAGVVACAAGARRFA